MTDADRKPADHADVCVIGSGPAGTFVTHALATAGYEVVVLEAGKRFDMDEVGRSAEQLERAIRPQFSLGEVWDMPTDRDTYTADVPSGVSFELNDRRVKAVGGTSLLWHGTVMRLPRKDFDMNSRYGVGTDWPISYEELKPFYREAEREMGVAGEAGPRSPPREEPFPLPPFPASDTDQRYIEACHSLGIDVQRVPHARNSVPYDGRNECQGYGTCSPYCPSGARYDSLVHLDRAEDAGATVIDRAVVTRLEHDSDGDTIERAVYRTPDDAVHRQSARHFVLACGPVETPRLLLLSRSAAHPDGLANRSGTVGRYFQATPYISTTARAREPTQPTQTGFDTSMSYDFYEPVSAEVGSIWMTFRNEDPTPVVERALQGGARHVREGLLSEVTGNPWGDELLEHLRAADPGSFSNLRISSYTEQLPRPENRILLDHDTLDPYGNPAPRVEFSFDDRVERTMERALELHREIFSQMDVDIVHEEQPLQRIGSDHKGTTRMGSDPQESVVAGSGRTHDLENLWIVGPSVFTHGGAVLPVLTAAALSLRTAEHLERSLSTETDR